MHTVGTSDSQRRSKPLSGARFALAATLVTLAATASGSACSRRQPAAEAAPTGAVAIALKLNGGSEITKVTYNVSGNGISPLTGTLDLTASNPQLLIKGVPAGNGLLVALSAVSTDSLNHCMGSVMVNVAAGVTQSAVVLLQCQGPNSYMTGGVLVDGRFDSCPYFRTYSVAPLSASVAAAPAETDGVGGAGGSSGSTAGVINLFASAGDEDGDALTFSITQNPEIGTLASVTTGVLTGQVKRTFTCTSVGTTVLTIGVTDGDCAAMPQVIPVSCTPAGAPAGQGGAAGGSGGDDGSGGAGGAAGAGAPGNGGNGGSSGGAGGGLAGAAGGTAGKAGQGGTAASAGRGGGTAGAAGGNGGAGGGMAGAGGGTPWTCAIKPQVQLPSECVSDACNACVVEVMAAEGENCHPSQSSCAQMTDATDRALCESAYACFVLNGCTNQGDPLTCWCGTNATTCITDNAPPTQANGPCLLQVVAAGKSMDAATLKARFTDPAFPLGRAVNLSTCRGGFCPAECNIK